MWRKYPDKEYVEVNRMQMRRVKAAKRSLVWMSAVLVCAMVVSMAAMLDFVYSGSTYPTIPHVGWDQYRASWDPAGFQPG